MRNKQPSAFIYRLVCHPAGAGDPYATCLVNTNRDGYFYYPLKKKVFSVFYSCIHAWKYPCKYVSLRSVGWWVCERGKVWNGFFHPARQTQAQRCSMSHHPGNTLLQHDHKNICNSRPQRFCSVRQRKMRAAHQICTKSSIISQHVKRVSRCSFSRSSHNTFGSRLFCYECRRVDF